VETGTVPQTLRVIQERIFAWLKQRARELELEIPAEEVTKKIESVAKEFARLRTCRDPARQGAGFADPSEVREDIKGEVLQSLVPSG